MKFYKTTWFKCVAVLLSILLVSGALIAILSDLLFVSPEMRTNRAIKKIYGEEMTYSVVFDADGEKNDSYLLDSEKPLIIYDEGRINKIYIIGDSSQSEYDLLFQSVGYQGYKGGSVTVWTLVKVSLTYNIDKVVLEGYEKQTLMSKFSKEYFLGFKLDDITDAYQKGELFTTATDGVNSKAVTGATYSATACVNAVNCVIKYVAQGGIQR